MPLANTLLSPSDLQREEKRFPLGIAWCSGCTLVQLMETVPPEQMFRNYFYFSSFSDTMLQHAAKIARRLIKKESLDANSLVVEIASNDGYLLKNYVETGVGVIGIEPAHNVAQIARERYGIPTIEEFFGNDVAQQLALDGRLADVVHANNVMAHVPDLNGFVQGIATVLKDSGVVVIETPYVKNMIDECEFDTIYHEHVFYYSLTAIEQLFRRHGLYVEDVELLSIHGGTLRVFARKEERARSLYVTEMLDDEKKWAFDRQYYLSYSQDVCTRQRALSDLLVRLKSAGKTIAAYGAAAKGSILLNSCNIGTSLLEYVVDRNTHKQGYYMPGVRVPILAVEKLLESQPDYLLLLTWNFAEEIIRQQSEYAARGGQFITSHPTPRIL